MIGDARSAAGTPPERFRREVVSSDVAAIRALVSATGVFRADEVDVAEELVRERLARGDASGYHFVILESTDGELRGYACYGLIPCTVASYDLYWIAVAPAQQRGGLGRRILEAVEADVAARGGTAIYVDTSGRAAYAPTRAFYERNGYLRAAQFADFYAPGDDKVVYVRRLQA